LHPCSSGLNARVGIHQACDSEIRDLNNVAVEEDVRRLQIAMQDALTMECAEGACNLQQHGRGPSAIAIATPAVCERGPRHELHDEK